MKKETITILLIALMLAVIYSTALMLLWNWLCPIFSLPRINLFQAGGLLLVVALVGINPFKI